MPATKQVSIERVELGGAAARVPKSDEVVVEAALAVSARGRRMLTVMRTPGHDLELVAGLLHAEGLPTSALAEGADGVDVDLEPSLFAARALTSVAGCGVCGRETIADLERMARAVEGDFSMPATLIAGLPQQLRAAQAVFDHTGGLHAAALCTRRGELVVVREDVGRHNAVDKVVGWALGNRLTAADHALVVSGRLGYEIVQKAVRFGVPLIAAVSAPSSLAAEAAGDHERVVRGDRLNIYSHGWRVE
jgi:FdhD protein